MSTQELDIKRARRVIRRHRRMVAFCAALGIAVGAAAAFVFPAMPTSKALVVLPPPVVDSNGTSTQDIETQVLIAGSAPVLTSAGQNVQPTLPVGVVRDRVQVAAVTQEIIEIKAKGASDRQAKDLANAVADMYVFYVTDSGAHLPKDLGKKVGARVLERATSASGGSELLHVALFAGVGGVAGALLGVVGILALARGDRRLYLRDEVSDAIGIPVLASLSAYRARGASAWADLATRYRPKAVDAWSLRKTLQSLGVEHRNRSQLALTVVSFVGDSPALSIGPQLAAFASSIGMEVRLRVETRHEMTAALIAGDPSARFRAATVPGAAEEEAEADSQPLLTVAVAVVERTSPSLADAAVTDATVVAVSAGGVTAEELARLAVAAAEDDRSIAGIVVADPEPDDRTTGRVAQPETSRQVPVRIADTVRGTVR